VEIEVENIQQFGLALECDPDIILLDNFSPDKIGIAVSKRRKARRSSKLLLEASGGITLGNVRAYAGTGIDRISVGALTHSARACDLSLLIRITP
jgi:nicotinate-nucleotide pyrophosphorylase (carboxylating)